MVDADARVMLLDTYGLVYRAFFALPLLTTTKGVPINAAYGFIQMLTKLIADERPTHLIACFDKGLPKARVALYPSYKAQRESMPDELRSQFALVRRILDVYRIPMLEAEGEEADDVIATLARQIEAAGARSEVVTGDLDLLQIVDARTTVLTTRRGITDLGRYDPAAVRQRFELDPAQLPDYRGLKGDPSDNLPGIPGIGEKTAIKLIKAAGSLDALLADPTLAGTPKLEGLIREHGETARVCRDVSVVNRE
ncbi:MAG: 5'-3' exonuclease, partial [Vulcanimicrobiaceae bacterium]